MDTRSLPRSTISKGAIAARAIAGTALMDLTQGDSAWDTIQGVGTKHPHLTGPRGFPDRIGTILDVAVLTIQDELTQP